MSSIILYMCLYQHWGLFKLFIRNAINEGYNLGTLSSTQRQGLVTCIPKADKPKQFIKNWRPITLLNVIYKIASGCIAERLKTVLTKLISSDQTGFISGRYIGENTRLIYDIMNITEELNIPGLLLVIDFEKAFDSISWEFINEVLKFFNFGESIIKWVSFFYKNISSAVIQSVFLSEFFPVQRGCRQGDPLSPYIFLLCAEILALMLKSNEDIQGIKIGGEEYKLSQFVDDTTILLDGQEKSLVETMKTLRLFASLSGLKINSSKTKAVWIGSKKFSGETFNHRFKFEWNQKEFTILGIRFSCNLNNMIELNYKEKLSQIEKELKQWSKRILTPLGRITILKTLIISKLNHLFISLPNPSDEIINTLQKQLFSFIWQSSTDRIKREILMQDYSKGGLKMLNIKNYIVALKTTWIRRLVTKDSKYINIFETQYPKVNDLIIRGAAYIKQWQKGIKNRFWKDVLEAWIKLQSETKRQKIEDILSMIIWNNDNFKIDNKPIFLKKWFDKKIYYVKDIINKNTFYTFEEITSVYNLQTNFLEYYGLINTIRRYIQSTNLQLENLFFYNCYIPFSLKIILKTSRGSKAMYSILNNKSVYSKSKEKWEQSFDNTELKWTLIYNIPVKCCNNTKMHWFQYRILHRILATNDLLMKYKIRDDNICSFCKREPEKLEHLFWYCEVVQDFWNKIEFLINMKSDYIFIMHKHAAFFGITFDVALYMPINYILILTKYYIHKCRIQNKQPNIKIWQNEVKDYLFLEKMIAIKNNTYERFEKNWNKWIVVFEGDIDSVFEGYTNFSTSLVAT